MTGRPSSPDSAGQIMRWRQWVQPLQTARDGELPIPQDRLSALHRLAGDGNDKAFRAALLAAAKDIHSTLKDDLAAEFEQGRDGAVYVWAGIRWEWTSFWKRFFPSSWRGMAMPDLRLSRWEATAAASWHHCRTSIFSC